MGEADTDRKISSSLLTAVIAAIVAGVAGWGGSTIQMQTQVGYLETQITAGNSRFDRFEAEMRGTVRALDGAQRTLQIEILTAQREMIERMTRMEGQIQVLVRTPAHQVPR